VIIKQRSSFAILIDDALLWSRCLAFSKQTRYGDQDGQYEEEASDDESEDPLERNDLCEQLPKGESCGSLAFTSDLA